MPDELANYRNYKKIKNYKFVQEIRIRRLSHTLATFHFPNFIKVKPQPPAKTLCHQLTVYWFCQSIELSILPPSWIGNTPIQYNIDYSLVSICKSPTTNLFIRI